MFAGPLQVRVGRGAWRTVSGARDGSFVVRLAQRRAGQGTIVVRSARARVRALREHVGVGDI